MTFWETIWAVIVAQIIMDFFKTEVPHALKKLKGKDE